MTDIEREFQEFLDRVLRGDAEAAAQLLEIYGPHVLRLVRRRLSHRLRSRFDSVDFVQSVWASVFREPDRLRRMMHPDELVQFLRAMARNKLSDETRRSFRTLKRSVWRETSMQEVAAQAGVAPEFRDERQPEPSDVAVAREQWDRIFGQSRRRHREIVALRFLGNTFAEIAEQLRIHERTARKIVGRMLRRVVS